MSDKKKPDWVIEQLQEEEFLASQVSLSSQDYKEAVHNLGLLANGDPASALQASPRLIAQLYLKRIA